MPTIAILSRRHYVEEMAIGIRDFRWIPALAEKWEQAGVPQGKARAMVNALAEEMRDEIATKEFVRAELANLRYQMLAPHLASFIGLTLLILFRT